MLLVVLDRENNEEDPVTGEFDVDELLEIDPLPVGPTEEEFPEIE
jgi:hypothetical protein